MERQMNRHTLLAFFLGFALAACTAEEIIQVEWIRHPRVTVEPDGVLTLSGKRTDLASKAFPVDPGKKYRFSMEIRRTPGAPAALCYIGNWCLASAGRKLQPSQIMAITGTDSALARAADTGAKEISIRVPARWVNNFRKERWGIVFGARKDISDLPNDTYIAIVSARREGDLLQLTLASPVKKEYPAGTPVRIHATGDGMYGGWKAKAVPETWTPIRWEVAGIAAPGNPVTQWWHGTVQGALRINANFNESSSLEVRNVRIEVLEAASTPAPAAAAPTTPSSPLMKLPLLDSVKIADFDIGESDASRHFSLPKFPARPGYIPVLRCRMGTYKDGFGGCCFAGKIAVSGTELGAQTAAGEVRMLGKHPRFEMRSTFAGRQFDYWAPS